MCVRQSNSESFVDLKEEIPFQNKGAHLNTDQEDTEH